MFTKSSTTDTDIEFDIKLLTTGFLEGTVRIKGTKQMLITCLTVIIFSLVNSYLRFIRFRFVCATSTNISFFPSHNGKVFYVIKVLIKFQYRNVWFYCGVYVRFFCLTLIFIIAGAVFLVSFYYYFLSILGIDVLRQTENRNRKCHVASFLLNLQKPNSL